MMQSLQAQVAMPAEAWPDDGLERLLACPVCSCQGRRLLYAGLTDRVYSAPGSWSLQGCLGCGAAYLDPRPSPATIGLAYADYFTHQTPPPVTGRWQSIKEGVRNSYLNACYGAGRSPALALGHWLVYLAPLLRRRVDRNMHSLPAAPGRLLDLGCGNGSFLAMARKLGWEVAGLEPDPLAAAECRRLGLEVYQGDLADDLFPPDHFDAITICHVIEHLHDPVAVLARCRRILKPGGMLWLATPNLASLGRRRYRQDWVGLDPPRHLVLFDEPALRRAIGSAGLAVERLVGTPSAAWHSGASLAIRQGGAALQAHPPRGWPGLLARLLDLAAMVWVNASDELVVIARRARH